MVKGALGARPLEVLHCKLFSLGQISPPSFHVHVCGVFACVCVHVYGCTCEGGMHIHCVLMHAETQCCCLDLP